MQPTWITPQYRRAARPRDSGLIYLVAASFPLVAFRVDLCFPLLSPSSNSRSESSILKMKFLTLSLAALQGIAAHTIFTQLNDNPVGYAIRDPSYDGVWPLLYQRSLHSTHSFPSLNKT